MANGESVVLRRRALRLEQDPKHPLYLFTLTAEELLSIADISRISRNEAGKLIGYQRPEVKKHVNNIVDYVDTGSVLFPNPIILALSSDVDFKQVRGPKVDEGMAEAGTLEIPLPKEGQPRPAWIVDGQQRALALSKAKNRGLVIPVNGFIADEVEVQRDQFLRINSAKPLPRGLITELLPEVSTTLPAGLAQRKAPSAICEVLNKAPESPFKGLIKRTSSKEPGAVVTDTAVISMVQESLTNPSGCLFPFRNVATGETDYSAVLAVLYMYWGAVKETFPDAWGRDPTESRLMHSAGIRAMGRLMDRLMSSIDIGGTHAQANVRKELARIKPQCHWTSGAWEELDGMKWNELQNLPAHIRMLSNLLIRSYVSARWSR